MKDSAITGDSNWITSSYCTAVNCVEVLFTADSVTVRDAKDRNASALVFTVEEWREFVSRVKNGEFDL